MDLTSLRILVCRREIRVFVICTVTGGVLQILSRRYIRNHPEIFGERYGGKLKEAEPGNKNRNPRFRGFFRRGGAALEVSSIIPIINFLAETGMLAGILTSSSIVLRSISTTTISRYLREAMPQTFSELERDLRRKQFTLVDGEKVHLDQCDQNLEYLFRILKDTKLPFKEKEKLTRSILTTYLDLKTIRGRLNFILCIVCILSQFSILDVSSYHILLKNLIKAIKEGRISKVVGRVIVRKLQKRGLLIDPELLDVVSS